MASNISKDSSPRIMEEHETTLLLEGATPSILPIPSEIDEHFGRGPGSKGLREVFHNSVMAGSRTRSVLLLHHFLNNSYFPEGPIRLLDGLGASGIRARRLITELPSEQSSRLDVHVCDILPESLSWVEKNAELFHPQHPLKLIQGDLRSRVLEGGWHWIDLDPYGSPMPFLDPVIQALSRNSILEVSATDTAALTGSSKGPTMRRYGAFVRTDDWAHDSGLRVLLANIARIAARHDRAIQPLLSVWESHHLRVSVSVQRSKQKASAVEKNIGWRVINPSSDELKSSIDAGLHSHGCADRSQPFCFLPFRHPVNHKDRRISGPLWTGPLMSPEVLLSFNQDLIEKLCVPCVESLTSWGFPSEEHDLLIENSRRSAQRAIHRFSEEAHVDPRASLFIVDRLHPFIPLSGPPSPGKLAEALTENGHPSCVSSYPNPAILTSAPWDIIYNLALEVSTAT
jgi:tRNA (guanine26-N2/guanine27-N2)-dimethyltransferase